MCDLRQNVQQLVPNATLETIPILSPATLQAMSGLAYEEQISKPFQSKTSKTINVDMPIVLRPACSILEDGTW